MDAEAPDAGFDEAYTGSQSASTGIMGMLEVIKGDFSRSISETGKAEEQAVRRIGCSQMAVFVFLLGICILLSHAMLLEKWYILKTP